MQHLLRNCESGADVRKQRSARRSATANDDVVMSHVEHRSLISTALTLNARPAVQIEQRWCDSTSTLASADL
jgi:hypothetical protein